MGMVVMLYSVACQAPTPTPIAFIATAIPPTIATPSPTLTITPTNTTTPTLRAKPTNTVRPRLQTKMAMITITPDTATPTPTRPPTNTPLPTPLAHEWDKATKNLLPAPLYYLANRTNEHQVWRIEKDGRKRRITNHPGGFYNFDVSARTGELVLLNNNGIWLSDQFGKNLRLLTIEGLDTTYGTYRRILHPIWSTSGSEFAFGYCGEIWIYNPAKNQLDKIHSPSSEYVLWYPFPRAWSPDDDFLLVVASYGGDTSFPVLVNVKTKEVETISVSLASRASWARDARFIYSASEVGYFGETALMQTDITSGYVIELMRSSWHEINAVTTPQEGDDGGLYFFHATVTRDKYPDRYFIPEYHMVRADLVDMTKLVLLRNETHQVLEALWVPDMSLAVIVEARNGTFTGRKVYVLTTDNRAPLLLTDFGFHLHWGKN